MIRVPEIRPAGRAILGRRMSAIDFCDRHIDEYKTDIRAMVSEIKYVVPLTGQILSGEELVTLICTL